MKTLVGKSNNPVFSSAYHGSKHAQMKTMQKFIYLQVVLMIVSLANLRRVEEDE